MLNQARLKVLKVREDHVRSVLDEARRRLGQVTKDQTKYSDVLESLVLQGLYQVGCFLVFVFTVIIMNEFVSQLFEENVTVRVRQEDQSLIENLLPTVEKKYKDATGANVALTIEQDSYLPKDTTGGVELWAKNGRIKINNTLEARLELIAEQLVPEIRTALFGRNPNRKFTD